MRASKNKEVRKGVTDLDDRPACAPEARAVCWCQLAHGHGRSDRADGELALWPHAGRGAHAQVAGAVADEDRAEKRQALLVRAQVRGHRVRTRHEHVQGVAPDSRIQLDR